MPRPGSGRNERGEPLEATEASEIADRIHAHHEEAHSAEADAKFRKLTGIYLGIVAYSPARKTQRRPSRSSAIAAPSSSS
jgi:hypothetical protein